MRRRRARGWTLIELMAVVAIVGLLAAAVTSGISNHIITTKQTRARQDLATIGNAIRFFQLDTGRLPQQLQDLWQRPADARRWGPNPYLEKVPPLDPWDREYVYARERSWVVRSLGGDGVAGGAGEDEDLELAGAAP